jgi:hypothetical protein
MDKEFLIRIFKNNCKVGHLNEMLSAIRRHETTKSELYYTTSKGKSIWINDALKLQKMYAGDYGKTPGLLFKIIYIAEKLFKGIYLKKLTLILKWNGKHISEILSQHSDVYKMETTTLTT